MEIVCSSNDQAKRIEACMNDRLCIGVHVEDDRVIIDQTDAEKPYDHCTLLVIARIGVSLRDWDTRYPIQ